MGSVELGELEKKVIPNCRIMWSQKVINHSKRIIEDCDTNPKILKFFEECEEKIKNINKEARIVWNTEIQRFGGDEFEYVWFIFSKCLNVPIKMSLKLETLSQIIIVGNMEIASIKNGKKLEKHLNTVKSKEEIEEKPKIEVK